MMTQINPPYETIDTPIYREAYRDLIKSRHSKYLTYRAFLKRMDERNQGIRKREFFERSFEVKNPLIAQAIKETINAGSSGKK
jgi:hypothetical protein